MNAPIPYVKFPSIRQGKLAVSLLGGAMFLAASGSARAGFLDSLTSSGAGKSQPRTPALIGSGNGSTAIIPKVPNASSAPDFAPVARAVKPAVVSVVAHMKESDLEEGPGGEQPPMQGGMPQGMPFGGFPFPFMMPGMPGMQPQQPTNQIVEARGSGFLVSADGYIVTNNHVVAHAKKVNVKMDDGVSYSAKIVGRDPKTDVALLKIRRDRPFPYLVLGNSDLIQPGQWVIAVGDPYGLGGTITAGIISALGRDLHSGAYNDFIQLDAAINRGNSGGPLLTLDGRVIGVNSMILSPNGGGSIGIGFAIPSDTVKNVISQLQKTGHVTRGYLGVETQNLTPALAQALGIKKDAAGSAPPRGALVASVSQGGPADRAGLKNGDIILSLDGKPVRNAHDLAVKVTSIAPGQEAKLGILRDGGQKTISFTVGNLNSLMQNGEDGSGSGVKPGRLGITLGPLTPRVRQELGLDEKAQGAAIMAVAPDGPAAHAGLQPGDVVVSIGKVSTPTPKAVVAQVSAALAKKQPVLMRILRDGQELYMGISLDVADDDAGAEDQDAN